MWTSKVPAAIDNLVSALQASPDMAGVGLRDGPRVVADWTDSVVTVGFTDDGDDTAAQGSAVTEGLAVNPERETFSIRCAAICLRGDEDISAARVRAYELLSIVGGVLVTDHTLGGAVLSARVGTSVLTQVQDERGAEATVVFDVDFDAFTG